MPAEHQFDAQGDGVLNVLAGCGGGGQRADLENVEMKLKEITREILGVVRR